jgi:AcrR family transcriptional regulator
MDASITRELMMFPPHMGEDFTSIWLDFGDDPDPTNRERLIFLTMREVAIVGPASFNTSGVCDTLGISYPMVNYYFGNRDGLIAESAYRTYVRYLDKMWAAVSAAPRTPVDRMRAYLLAHLRLNVEISGWGAVLNYPIFSSTVAQLLNDRFGEDQRQHFELNMARLARLIVDLWEGQVTEPLYTLDDYPREQLIANDRLMAATATLSWATLGVAVWRSGGHSPSRGISELVAKENELMDAYRESMIRAVQDLRPQ